MAKGKDPSDTIQEFKRCVNMDAKELEEWLKTSGSNRVCPFALPTSASKLSCHHGASRHASGMLSDAQGVLI